MELTKINVCLLSYRNGRWVAFSSCWLDFSAENGEAPHTYHSFILLPASLSHCILIPYLLRANLCHPRKAPLPTTQSCQPFLNLQALCLHTLSMCPFSGMLSPHLPLFLANSSSATCAPKPPSLGSPDPFTPPFSSFLFLCWRMLP